ncbi:GNAT family N-acetyltransferase [Sporolactobacillus vineae]|uniref:GNAT family N-acetyltransferase n=1 Tax=Sporolactobacillus vineae TaxID=444463 RepID=UPI000289A153|nr:GNAT family N-acetyltransferase [Sporolactobacillus vineae]
MSTIDIINYSNEYESDLFRIYQSIINEKVYLLTDPAEFYMSEADFGNRMESLSSSGRENTWIALANGLPAGFLFVQSSSKHHLQHVGSFGIGVLAEYRGKGIGQALIVKMLDWAKKNNLIEKVALGVFSINQAAIHLYKKMGFVEEGRKVNEIKFSQGHYADDVLMYQMVQDD